MDELKKQERKIYLRCLLAVVIGVVAILAGLQLKKLPSGILVISGILIIITTLATFSRFYETTIRVRGILREKETGEEYRESYIDWPPWVKKYGGVIYLVIIMIGFRLFAPMHENDFGGLKFVWHSLLAGLLLGIAVFYVLRIKFSSWTDNPNKNAEMGFYVILATMFLFICLGPLINKQLNKSNATCRSYPIIKKGFDPSRDKYLYVMTEKGKERFQPERSFIRRLDENDSSIILCVKKGYLGYDFVESFKPAGK